jgi:hypothetical protein
LQGGGGGGKGDAGSPVSSPDAGGTPPADAGTGVADASDDTGAEPIDAAPAPRNAACTPLSAQTGNIANTPHGRLDGTLVYVVPLGGPSKCNGDNSHVHLQVEVSGLVYDVAVDVGQSGDEVGLVTKPITVPGGAWSAGWGGSDSLSYPSFGLTSNDMPLQDPATIASEIEAAVASTSEVSIFCTSYSPQGNGCHDVHYESGHGNDGAIVLDPSSATPTVMFFRFQDQTF